MIRLRNIKLTLAGMLILPLSLATLACSPIYADDPNPTQGDPFDSGINIEALKTRIQTAVENGEITQDQVDKGIEIFRIGFGELGRKPSWTFESIKTDIAAALENGEITQEEADAKLDGVEGRKEKGKQWHSKRHHHKKPMMDIEDVKAKISAMLENGELTQEEAQDKLRHLKWKLEKVKY